MHEPQLHEPNSMTDAAPASPGRPNTSASARWWVPIVLLLAAASLLVIVIWRVDTSPRTDDAYVYADTIQMAPQVSGRIVYLAVKDNQAVREGDVLFRIDARPYEDDLEKARASLAQLNQQILLTQRSVNAQSFNAQVAAATVDRARASARQAQDTLARTEPLLAKGYVSADDLDRARTAAIGSKADLDAAQAQARQAKAAVSGVDALVAQRAVTQAEISSALLNIEYATVRAPFDGRVVSLTTTTGQFASPTKPVFTLVDTRQWFVIANFRETELKRIYLGTPATVYLMSDTRQRFRGTVESIGYGVTPEDGGSLAAGLPQVQRSINWVHVSQRFPVRIRIEHPDPGLFRVGTSAVALLHLERIADGGSP